MTRVRPMTSFIGRERSLRATRAMLGESRLVTVTGPGGIGKTRLAREALARAAAAFPEGTAVVELADLQEDGEVASAVASALAVPDQSARSPVDQIVRHLSGRRTLLLVDNCEHVLDATADLLQTLLGAVEGLSVIATSREPLGLPGEQIHALGPLDLPDPERDDAAQIDGSEAVRLLVDRARALVPDFAVTDDNRAAVVQLCARLDGMPLAIELATARFRSLSVEQVLDRLDARFILLTNGTRGDPAHHRTLWALVDWSHDLCTPAEQRLWARLSVFPASFDLDAAEAVCADAELTETELLDVLDRLVAKSIVTAEPHGPTMRYRLLVTMREYGAHQLGEGEDRAATKRRHRDHYLARAERMVGGWCGPDQPRALAVMREDHPNHIAALEWSVSVTGEEHQAARLAALLRYHWIAGGRLSDGRRWLERVLDLDVARSPGRGAALWVAAWVCLIQGDRDRAQVLLEECRAIAVTLDDEVLMAHADHWTGLWHAFCGRTAAAIDHYRAAISVFDRQGLDAPAGTALFQMAMAQTYEDEHAAALATCTRVLDLSERHGEQWCRAYALWVTSVCQWHLGDAEAAARAGVAALELQRAFQDGICIALTVELLAWLAHDAGDDERSAELSGAAGSVWAQIGTSIEAFGPKIHAESRAVRGEVDRRLGAGRADRRRASAAGVTRLGAVELALGAHSEVADSEEAPLTPREQQVAALIERGLTNRAIAEQLVISPRTVDGHVERIFGKLEVTSRSQIAAWAAGRDR
ncbi:LuxR C-terminal-related transcriptional regulator [Janibacter sp. LM]|uniref:ATP-binding protein n=1 Tax=Janibacter sp. LM TaxID=3144845 RepID=UPI0031F6362C